MIPFLLDVQIAQLSAAARVVRWRLAVDSVPPPGTAVRVFRSYGPADGFQELGLAPVTQSVWVDADVVTDKNVDVYYRLQLEWPGGSRVYGPFHLRDRPDRIARFIQRRVGELLRNINATPVLVYQTAFGAEAERCPTCWDAVLGQIIYSNCRTCQGTSFIGSDSGYYLPLLTLADIRPFDRLKTIEDVAQAPVLSTARMAAYPLLRPTDLLREVNTGVIWKVTAVTLQRNNETVVSQDPIQLRQVKLADIEYEIPIPEALTPLLRRRNERLLQVLTSVVGADATFVEVLM